MGHLIAIILSITLAQAADTRMRVAVLDTGLPKDFATLPWVCLDGHVDLTGTTIVDVHGHGSNVSSIIGAAINPARQCLVMIKWTTGGPVKNHIPIVDVYTTLRNKSILWINYSASGKLFATTEGVALFSLTQGIYPRHVSIAAGNDSQNLAENCDVFPACYPINNVHWHVVANGKDGLAHVGSNYGGPVNAMEDGKDIIAGGYKFSGTSQATALYTARLIRMYNATR